MSKIRRDALKGKYPEAKEGDRPDGVNIMQPPVQEIGELPPMKASRPPFIISSSKEEKHNKELAHFLKEGYKLALKELFEKFDKYACIKNDKWYLDFKKEKLNVTKLGLFKSVFKGFKNV